MFFFKFIISCLSIFISHLTLLTLKGLANILFIFYYPPINQYFFVIFFKNNKEYFISGAFAEFFCKYPSKLSNHRYFGLILL